MDDKNNDCRMKRSGRKESVGVQKGVVGNGKRSRREEGGDEKEWWMKKRSEE